MAIVNLAYHRGPYFWDGRAATLEQMVLMPIQDPIEMGLELGELVARLEVEPGYAELFERAFGRAGIDEDRIAIALVAFVRAIVSHRSRYDEGLAAVDGDIEVGFPNFTASENRGKQLFFGRAPGHVAARSCAACHVDHVRSNCGSCYSYEPAGLVPASLHNNGLPPRAGRRDDGRGAISGRVEDRGRFRAASLRNVAVTGPYMHDGRFRTLDEVLDFYANGVRRGPNLAPEMRAAERSGGDGGSLARAAGLGRTPSSPMLGPPLGFPMSSGDRRDLIAFLETLTDQELLRDPRFADPFER